MREKVRMRVPLPDGTSFGVHHNGDVPYHDPRPSPLSGRGNYSRSRARHMMICLELGIWDFEARATFGIYLGFGIWSLGFSVSESWPLLRASLP